MSGENVTKIMNHLSKKNSLLAAVFTGVCFGLSTYLFLFLFTLIVESILAIIGGSVGVVVGLFIYFALTKDYEEISMNSQNTVLFTKEERIPHDKLKWFVNNINSGRFTSESGKDIIIPNRIRFVFIVQKHNDKEKKALKEYVKNSSLSPSDKDAATEWIKELA